MATDIELNTKINTANSAQALGELKKSLRDLISLQSQVGSGTTEYKKLQDAITKTESKLGDLKDGFRTLSGSGVERVNLSLGLFREGLLSADSDKLKIGLKGIGAAMSALPIFLVIESIKLLYENFDKITKLFGFGVRESDRMAESLSKQKKANEGLYSTQQNQIKIMEAHGVSVDKIYAAQKRLNDIKILESKIDIELQKQKIREIFLNDSVWEQTQRAYAAVLRKTGNDKVADDIEKKLFNDKLKRSNEFGDAIRTDLINISNLQTESKVAEIKVEEKHTNDLLKTNKERSDKLKEQSITDADQLFKELIAQQDFELKLKNEARAKEKKEYDDAFNQRIADEKFISDFIIEQSKKEIEIEKFKVDQKKAFRDADFAIATAGVGLFKSLVGKNKDLQKVAIIAENAVGIAKMIINNAASNTAITAQGAALAIPSGGVSVATAAGLVLRNNILTGLNVAAAGVATGKALQALGGGGGGGVTANVASDGGGGASVPKQDPQSLAFNKDTINQAGGVGGNQANQPQKVVLVSHDVTRAQRSDRLIELQSTF